MSDQLRETRRRANLTFIGAIIILAVINGTYSALTVFAGDLCTRLNASVTDVMLMFTVCSVVSMVANLVSGALMARVPTRILAFIGTLCFIAFFLLMRFATSLAMLYVGAGLFGISTVFSGFTTLQPLVTWWHAKGTGTKLSILSVGFALFGSLESFVAPRLLVSVGFEKVTLYLGLILGVVACAAALLLLSDKPEKYGLKAYGYSEDQKQAAPAASGMPFNAILRTAPFWLLMICVFLLTIASTGYVNNASTYYQSLGLSSTEAGTMISVYGIATMFLNLMFGVLADKISTRKACMLYGVLCAVVFAAAAFVSGSASAWIVALLIGSINYSTFVVAMNAGAIYGPAALGSIVPMGMFAMSAGAMFGSPLAGAFYDSTGSYSNFMICAAILCALALVAVLWASSSKNVKKLQERAAAGKEQN